MPTIYQQLTKMPEIKNILDWPFDFKLCEPYLLSSAWPISVSTELVVLAEEGAGGVFAILENHDPEKSPLIYITSEGQAGKIANSLMAFISILVAVPCWRDGLKFPTIENVDKVRAIVLSAERELLEYEPELNNKKQLIIDALNLIVPSDPIQMLIHSVQSPMGLEIKARDGFVYESFLSSH